MGETSKGLGAAELLARKARELSAQKGLEKQEIEAKAADSKTAELKQKISEINQLESALIQIRQQKTVGILKISEQKRVIAEINNKLEEQLNTENSELQQLFRELGIDSIEKLLQFIEQTAKEMGTEAEEPKAMSLASGALVQDRKSLGENTQEGLRLKKLAVEFLKQNRPNQGGEVDFRNPGVTEVEVEKEGTDGNKIKVKIPRTLSRTSAEHRKVVGLKPVTFETLVKALELQRAIFEEQYSEEFSKTTEGRKKEQARADVKDYAKRIVAKKPILLTSNELDPELAADLEFTVQEIGREQVVQAFLAGAEEVLLQRNFEQVAEKEGMSGKYEEIKRQALFFSEVLPRSFVEVKDLKNRLDSEIEQLKNLIGQIAGADPKLRAGLNYEEGRKNPSELSGLNRVIVNLASRYGLEDFTRYFIEGVTSGVLADEHSEYDKLRLASNANNTLPKGIFVSPEKVRVSLSGGLSAGIPNPDYAKAQIENWIKLIAGFKNLLAGKEKLEAASFLQGYELARVADRELTEQKLGIEKLDTKLTKTIELPLVLYRNFAPPGKLAGGFWRAGQVLEGIEKKAGQLTDQEKEKLKLKLEASFLQYDIRQLETSPDSKDLLETAKIKEINKEKSEDVFRNADPVTRNGAHSGKYDNLVTALGEEKQVTVSYSKGGEWFGRGFEVFCPALVTEKEEAQKAIEGFNRLYVNQDNLRTQIAKLKKEISDFESRLVRIDFGGKHEKNKDNLTKLEGDLKAWGSAKDGLKEIDDTKKAIDSLNKNSLKEKPVSELQLSETEVTKLTGQQTLAEFFRKLAEMVKAMNSAQLTAEESELLKKYKSLKRDLEIAKARIAR